MKIRLWGIVLGLGALVGLGQTVEGQNLDGLVRLPPTVSRDPVFLPCPSEPSLPSPSAPCAPCPPDPCFPSPPDPCLPCPLEVCQPITWEVFAEALYLRPRDAEIAFGIPVDSADPSFSIPRGPTAVVDPDYEPAFRFGFTRAWDECSSVGGRYTHFESQTANTLTANPPLVIRAPVLHPGTASASTAWLHAEAQYDIDFDLIDVDYRRVFSCSDRHTLTYLLGVRYARLQQDFAAQFTRLGVETVATGIAFDGGGLRVGLEGERRASCCGLLLYGRAEANFVAGDFRAHYLQTEQGVTNVETTWKAGRLVSMLDLELGCGWVSSNGCFRVTAGYLVSAWYNAVITDEFIAAVHDNDSGRLGGNLTFDGLVGRAEVRF